MALTTASKERNFTSGHLDWHLTQHNTLVQSEAGENTKDSIDPREFSFLLFFVFFKKVCYLVFTVLIEASDMMLGIFWIAVNFLNYDLMLNLSLLFLTFASENSLLIL